MNNLALSYAQAGRVAEGVKLVEEALTQMRRTIGPEDSRTIKVMKNLANAYLETGRGDDEFRLRSELLETVRKSSSPNPSEEETVLADLADVQLRRKEFAAADALHAQVLESRRRRPNAERSATVAITLSYRGQVLTDWAWLERDTNRASALTRVHRAEAMLQEALVRHRQLTNLPSWRTANVQCQLGGALSVSAFIDSAISADDRERKLSDAESLLLEGHAGLARDKISYAGDRHYAVERITRHYAAWEKIAPNRNHAAQAAEWRDKLAEFDRTIGDAKSRDGRVSDGAAEKGEK
jgi:hypothetical protein